MKYSLLSVQRLKVDPQKLYVSNKELEYDREENDYSPNFPTWGQYLYPTEMDTEKAFEKLKQAMIDYLLQEIINRQSVIHELTNLKVTDSIKEILKETK